MLLVFWTEAVIIGIYGLLRLCVSFWFGNPFGLREKVPRAENQIAFVPRCTGV